MAHHSKIIHNKKAHKHKENSGAGEAIFVGIGCSLSIEDTPALHLVKELARRRKDVCAVNLEHSFALLPDIVESHKSIYIVDSIVCDGPTGSILILPLNDEIFEQKKLEEDNGLQFSSTHAISWFDELKLARLQGNLKQHITFIGVESKIAFDCQSVRQRLFEHAIEVVEAVLASDFVELTPKSVLPCGPLHSTYGD